MGFEAEGARRPTRLATQHVVWIVALFVAAASIAVSSYLIPFFSPTNDDAYIQQSLSGGGGVSAYPTPYTTAINFVLGCAVSGIYSLFPNVNVPWWIIIQLLFLCLALALFNRTILALALTRVEQVEHIHRIKGIRHLNTVLILAGITALLFLDLGLFAALISRLQFTNTASLLMSIPIFSTCCWRPEEQISRGGILTRIALPVLLASLGFSYRSQSGYLGLLFWAVAIAAIIFSTPEGDIRKRMRATTSCWLPLALTCAMAASLVTINMVARALPTQPASDTYRDFSTFVDYPHPSFEDDPGLYESVGWDATLLSLVESWFMLDDRVNSETLSILAEASSSYAFKELASHPITTTVYRLRDIVQPTPLAYLGILFLIGMLALASARTVGETSINILAITLSAALVVYLFIHGRLPERAALSIFLPATACFASAAVRQIHQSLPRCRVRLSILFVVGLFIFLPLAAIAPNNGARAACIFPVIGCGLMLAAQFTPTAHRRRGPCITSTVLMFVLFASAALTPLLAAGYSYGWTSIYQTQQQRLLNNTGDFFSYAREHSDTLFIYSHASITLQYVWLYDWPENQVGWGGWYYGYAWFNEAMERYGLNGRPTSDDLFSDNVRFVSASEQTCRQLLSYLQESYGASVTLTQVDAVNEEIKVYSITQED